MSPANPSSKSFDTIVIGAGVAGLYQVYQLREQGFSVRGFDAASGVGGTWYWNRYPGAKFDSECYIYQYLFSEELYKGWRWSERFPGQPEIERWMNYVADKLDLRKEFQFETTIASAHYDEARGRWTVAFLGFTHCPDVCPTTLAELASAEKRWREALPEPQRPQMLFVSVDPERDSPDRVGDYAQFFSPHALAATGSVADLERFGASLLLVFTKVPLPGDNADAYTIDHSTQAVLIDPHGRFAGFIRPERDSDGRPLGMPPDKVARDLIALAQWQP